ncbi:sensor histidine kinase [Methylobacterium sp. EM32]|uniref:sensor histidine kinase n=1 Tax=Methylobacterium sp. EM32 TaxID=3163481 RepID=UPI0033A0E353
MSTLWRHRASTLPVARWTSAVGDRDAAWTLLEQARQEERLRLARDLHDQTGQQIACIKLGLHILKQDLAPADAGKIGALTDLVDELAQDIGRTIADLRPPGLDTFGLIPTLQMLFDDWAGQSGGTVEFTADASRLPSLPTDLEVALFRIAQEALTNTMKHAADATFVRFHLHVHKSELTMTISDDGAGFDAGTPPRPGTRGGWGIRGMQERAARVGGELLIHSTPGTGTLVRVQVPVRSSAR